MKVNLTSILLLGVLGLVAYKLVKDGNPNILTGGQYGTAQPTGGQQTVAQQDVFSTVMGTINTIFGAVDSIAKTQVSTT